MANLQIPDSGTLLTKEEMVAYMDEKFEEIKKLLTSNPPPKPEPELPECKKKPTIKKVTSSSDNKRLTVLFDAEDVFKMAATVRLEASGMPVEIKDIVSSKTGKSLLLGDKNTSDFAPDNNTPVLVFNSKLQPSPTKYIINFKAIECKGEGSYTFFFDDVVVPPPEPEKPCKPPTGKIVRVELTLK